MSSPQIEIQILAAIVAAACAIPGVFLVLRKMALISDAIGHSILPGIVIGFFITQDLNSPLLVLLAALTGVVTVAMVEYLQKTRLVKEDTAIGLVFPALFSIGVIMISRSARDIHLDIDAVLLGELAFTPFNRLEMGGIDLGPKSLWVMSVILVVILILLFLFFKELKVSTFDAGLSSALGLSPVVIHYGLMSVSSITVVGAFDAVGSILVVALMIVPAGTSYLLTTDLKKMIGLSVLFGVVGAIAGYWVANILDASIAGSIATTLGFIFFVVFLVAPGTGLLSNLSRQKQQQLEVSLITFLLHLSRHQEESERHVSHLTGHFDWKKRRAEKVLALAQKNKFISVERNVVQLTSKGMEFAQRSLEYITENKIAGIENLKGYFFLFRR